MTRVRSPNYPQISLSDAVTRVSQVFGKERQHAAPRQVVLKHLGYSSINGASLGTLSGIAKYGLLERVGEDYRVSDRAMTILYPPSPEAKAEALNAAAREPSLFSEIFEHFGGVLPSDDNLQSYLIRKGFADSGAKAVIRVLRDTMEFVMPQSAAATSQAPTKEGTKPLQIQQVEQVARAPVAAVTANDWHVAQTPQGLKLDAVLIDQAGIDRLIAILNANKLLLPDRVRPPQAEGPTAEVPSQDGSDT